MQALKGETCWEGGLEESKFIVEMIKTDNKKLKSRILDIFFSYKILLWSSFVHYALSPKMYDLKQWFCNCLSQLGSLSTEYLKVPAKHWKASARWRLLGRISKMTSLLLPYFSLLHLITRELSIKLELPLAWQSLSGYHLTWQLASGNQKVKIARPVKDYSNFLSIKLTHSMDKSHNSPM